MKGEDHYRIELSFSVLYIDIYSVGEDMVILLYGGDRPHIGCTVLSIPRPSLTGDGTLSATSSVFNVTGHKDEVLCRYTAEAFCKATSKVTVCSGGFHQDDISCRQVEEVKRRLEEFIDMYNERWRSI